MQQDRHTIPQKILFIGFGTMGYAIATSLHKKKKYQLLAIDPYNTKNAEVLGIPYYSNLQSIADHFQSSQNLLIVLAVKPQQAYQICQQLSSFIRKNDTIISIIAGIHSSVLQKLLHTQRIIRFMPTIGATINKSVTGIYVASQQDHHELTEIAQTIANTFGTSYVFSQEEHIAAITGISGSGIAFVTAFLDAMILAGIREGLTKSQAQSISLATMESVCSLLSPKGNRKAPFSSPSDCIQAICSPAGTTIEGIHSLHSQSFYAIIMNAVHQARIKADSIEQKIKQETYTTTESTQDSIE